ncbi:cell division protein FtsL [Motiliproteus sp. SC1-56]|uniref:cell division protein FtsL n=1 Tax=Motiliproteus sp. SC1-56 TaxID=2799565 RepID=UPI001F5D23C3|nr:cell division protein FtsL [Motiliproteus sp. SC1-56]
MAKQSTSSTAEQGIEGGRSWMAGASALLAVFVVLSALGVIYSAYLYRQLFNEQQQLFQVRNQLQVEWGQLLLEQSALASHSRIEQVVSEKLDMHVPSPESIVVVNP